MIINENCSEGGGSFADKSLGVWNLSELPAERNFGSTDMKTISIGLTHGSADSGYAVALSVDAST
jgi:hypothetical protein